MLTALPTNQIYEDIDPAWYNLVQPTENGQSWYSAQIYFHGPNGQYCFYSSTGPDSNTVDALRWDAARFLSISQCTGGITNVKPASFEPLPIYFK